MTKRESGWYLVRFDEEYDFWIAKYSSESDKWLIHGFQYGMHDKDFVEIKEMVMTPSGELVYHKAKRDPVSPPTPVTTKIALSMLVFIAVSVMGGFVAWVDGVEPFTFNAGLVAAVTFFLAALFSTAPLFFID
ncbi:Uncharacterised protein [Plesiomonas shigelloides]|uniref:hypothetical protein n=1 Tax=Plesiomonas shigelloides TaxID=703 RepID=UPI000E056334|nr:hypothetical protein [Plesiomonas shigelloides]SUB64031.1 Uncharacterised protein [Plesiomonas shigelloides]